ncbi:MAG: hypothetical protein KDC34_13225 [Saprospiraceae bacterium]|nr:hypothetical protein [Saprospiraceae bacterium]
MYYLSLMLLFIFLSCNGRKAPQLSENNQAVLEHKSTKNYELSDAVRCGFLDSDGIMWFGTNKEGVYRYDGTSFVNFSMQDGLCSNYISCITADNAGNLWFGTDAGLCRYDKKTFTHIAIPWDENENLWGPGLNANLVLSLLNDKKGNIWFGTWGSGAYRFDPLEQKDSGAYEFTGFLQNEGAVYDDSLPRNVIQCILEDTEGNIWLTSMSHDGVNRYDGSTFTHFMPSDGLSDDMVFSCFQDKTGNLWFGSLGNRNGCLDRYDGNIFTHFNEDDGLCSNNVICIYEDSTGKFWLGSGRGELCIFNPNASNEKGEQTFTPFTTLDGRSFEGIRFITEDGLGDIWFGGSFGSLFRYDGTTITDFTQK